MIARFTCSDYALSNKLPSGTTVSMPLKLFLCLHSDISNCSAISASRTLLL